MKIAFGIEKPIGDQGMDMRMKIEVFAESMEGQEEGWSALGEIQSDPEEFGYGLLGEGAKPFQEAAMAQEGRAEDLGQGQDEMAVGHWEQDMVD